MRTSRWLTPYPVVSHVSWGFCPTPPTLTPVCRQTWGGRSAHPPPPRRHTWWGGSAYPPPIQTICLDADATLVMWSVMHAGKKNNPPPGGRINTCENITLPQTSFVGGKNAGLVTTSNLVHVLLCLIAFNLFNDGGVSRIIWPQTLTTKLHEQNMPSLYSFEE